MHSPDQMDAKSFQVSLYGRHAETKPVLTLSSAGSIQIPVSGGGTSTIFSGSNADVKMTADLDAAIAAIAFKPREGLSYRLKLGQVHNFGLEYSSGSFTNKLSSENDGFIWGAGVRWNVTQGTLVSSAINFDFGYTQTLIDLTRFESNSIVSGISEKFSQDEYQAALSVSKRWGMWEPYGGAKVFRVVSHLQDNSTQEKIKGHVDGISPFVGLKIEVFDREYIVIEGSFVDEESLNAGMSVRF